MLEQEKVTDAENTETSIRNRNRRQTAAQYRQPSFNLFGNLYSVSVRLDSLVCSS